MMMMKRSSSAPQPAARRGHRRRASDTPASTGLVVPPPFSCASGTLRRHYSCSSSWGGVPPLSASPEAASTASSAAPTASPATATSPEDVLTPPHFASGTLELISARVGVPLLLGPASSQQTEAPELPSPLPPPQPSPRLLDGMPDNVISGTPPTEPSRSPTPAVESTQRPEPEAQTKESAGAALGAVCGTCMVCLEDCDDVLGPAWLHPYRSMPVSSPAGGEERKEGEIHVGSDDCAVSACLACLKTYFTGIVEGGFDGACPRMRCMCCPRVVCERAWAPLVEPSVLATFRKRAATLLSIQCGTCDGRGTIMVSPPIDHSFSLALDKLVAAADSAITNENSGGGSATPAAVASTSTSTPAGSTNTTASPPTSIIPTALASADINRDEGTKASTPSCLQRAELKKVFLAALERYTSGEDIDVTPCYLALERLFSEPEIGAMTQEGRDGLMLLLLNCIEDSERRASLHIRFIRSNPIVKTRCCSALHCFRCRVMGGHPSQTCEQFEAQRGPEFVCKCPGCGVYVVKGDGCDSITCICGRNFSWSQLVNDRQMMVANALRDAHPEGTGRAAMEIIRRALSPAADAAVADEEEVCGVGDDNLRMHTGEQQPSPAEQLETAQRAGEQEQDWGPETAEQSREPEGPVQELIQELVEDPFPGHDGQEQLDRAPFRGTGQEPVTPEGQQDQLDPLLPAGGALSAEDELRLANAYVAAYPREAAEARAAMFGEENPHFTVQRAYAQLDQDTWRRRAPALSRYLGRPRDSSAAVVGEAQWQAGAAGDWLNQNRAEVELERRRTELARSALVEAFYGDDTRLAHSTAITHTAAEHARAALRVTPPLADNDAGRSHTNGNGRRQQQGTDENDQDQEVEPLFRWLGIVEPPAPVPTAGGDAESSLSGGDDPGGDEVDDEEEETWEVPFAEAEIEEDVRENIPPPSALWRPWPVGRGAPARPRAYRRRREPVAADPPTRQTSPLSAFGTIPLRREVERWVAGSTARQERLRRVMAVEERELSKAWVALWGRRLCLDPSTRTWVDANDDENAAICAAARRVIFLEAHPEQACAEQRAMMKAFVRRNRAAIANAREEATAGLAAAWERQHAATPANGVLGAASTFDRAYAAYLHHVETRPSQVLSAALAACSTSATPASTTAMTRRGLRRADRMAEAWESINHRRVCARHFADKFARSTTAGIGQEAKGEGAGHEAGAQTVRNDSTSAVAAVAVVALYVAPMLLGRSSQMCDCDMEGVVSDAADWASFNPEAFDKEVERVDRRVAATTITECGAADEQRAGGFVTGRALEGCECGREGPSLSSCSHLVACPAVTRRILKVSEPLCSECEFADGLLSGDLFDLFE